MDKENILLFFNMNFKIISKLAFDSKVSVLFDLFTCKNFYDTTKNIINKRHFYSPYETVELMKMGYGLHCQEQAFLLKEIFLLFDIDSKIVHGDIYDFDAISKKDLITTALYIDVGNYFYHIDPIKKIILKVEKYTSYILGNIEISDISDSYYKILKYDNNEIFHIEIIYKNLEEDLRKNRIQNNYAVMPFGVIAPFFWSVNPERKIFYNVIKDKVRINIDRKIYFFDVMDWHLATESNWLNKKQKQAINFCIYEIISNIDEYLKIVYNSKNKKNHMITKNQLLELANEY